MNPWYVTEGKEGDVKYWRYNRNYAGVPADELDSFTFSRAVTILRQMFEYVWESPRSQVIICRGAR